MENALLGLKSEREKKNISLDKVAAETRISIRYLQSIEEGRFDDLPGGVYNRAFIKAYCESINLDPEPVLKIYDDSQPSIQPAKHSKAIIPLPEPDAFSLPVPVIVWSVILLAAVLGGYLGRGWIAETFSGYFSPKREIAETIAAAPEYPQPVDIPIAEENLQEPVPAPGVISAEPAPGDIQPPVAENRIGDYPAAETISPSTALSNKVESSDAEIRVELKAIEPCWISVSIDGAPSVAKTMKPGGTELYFADERARIKIGNAGGISLKINDMPAKPLGGTGEVVSMDINPQNIKQFTD